MTIHFTSQPFELVDYCKLSYRVKRTVERDNGQITLSIHQINQVIGKHYFRDWSNVSVMNAIYISNEC